MTITPATRLSQIQPTIFTTMSRLAVEHNAVNLGQGFPDFDGPAWIIDELAAAARAGRNQYAHMFGTVELRRSISSLYARTYDLAFDPETEITVTAGATEALFSAMFAFLEAGDEVILFEPYYDSHYANVLLAGAVPRFITLRRPDFRFSFEELAAAITSRTKMIVLNTPHNPLGKVFDMDELQQIAELAKRFDLIVVSDEVYEFLTYDDARHIPIATLDGMRERTITISSSGKTFGFTGWKIGYALAPESLTRAIRSVHQFVTFAVNTPAQIAIARAFERIEEYLPELRALYTSKRDLMLTALNDTVFTPHRPRGSYFIMVDIPEHLGLNDVDAAMRLVTQHGVALIPPSVFYNRSDEGSAMLRICFAKKDETLREGVRRLSSFGKEVKER